MMRWLLCGAAAMAMLSGCASTTLEYGSTGYVPTTPPVQALPKLQGSTHTVKPGETLWRIARSYGLDAQALASANRLPANGNVTVGQQLFIPLPPESNRFLWPVRGSSTLSHSGGIDVSAAPGTLVRASRTGRVAVATAQLSGWGNTVVLDHPDGTVTVYAGMQQCITAAGTLLRQGMPVGIVGARPVHFEIRNGSKPVNALSLLPRE